MSRSCSGVQGDELQILDIIIYLQYNLIYLLRIYDYLSCAYFNLLN
jgi:hypothetical protein